MGHATQLTGCQGPKAWGVGGLADGSLLLCHRGCGAELPCGSGVGRLLLCVCYLETMGDLWLISVRTGLPAVEANVRGLGHRIRFTPACGGQRHQEDETLVASCSRPKNVDLPHVIRLVPL